MSHSIEDHIWEAAHEALPQAGPSTSDGVRILSLQRWNTGSHLMLQSHRLQTWSKWYSSMASLFWNSFQIKFLVFKCTKLDFLACYEWKLMTNCYLISDPLTCDVRRDTPSSPTLRRPCKSQQSISVIWHQGHNSWTAHESWGSPKPDTHASEINDGQKTRF